MQNENEIIFREKQHRRLKDLHEPADIRDDGYQAQMPMSVENAWQPKDTLSPGTSSPETRAKPTGLAAEPVQSLSTIHEAGREQNHISPGFKRRSETMTNDSAMSQDDSPNETAVQSTNRKLPLLQYLNQAWYLVPAGKNHATPAASPVHGAKAAATASSKPGRDAVEVLGALESPKHTIDRDRAVTVSSNTDSHVLDTDAPTSGPRSSKFKEHFLESDETSSRGKPIADIAHHLGLDSSTATGKTSAEHDISDDHVAPSGRPDAGVSHGLEHDAPVDVRAQPTKHHLDVHETVASGTERPSHILDSDPSTTKPGRAKPHFLETHEEIPAARASSSHQLDEH